MVTYLDRMADFFKELFKRNLLVEILSTKITPTWKNNKKGEKGIGKRLEKFLMSEYLLAKVSRFIYWVLVSTIYDHSPIVFQFEQELMEFNHPFKFNHTWIKYASFCQMVIYFWIFVSIPEGLNEMDIDKCSS